MVPCEHVAIVDRLTVRHLLVGHKRIESRFLATKRPPYDRVKSGDRVYFKLAGGSVIGSSTVTRVRQYADLTPAAIIRLRRRYNHLINAEPSYWQARLRCRYGLLLWITAPIRPATAMHVPRQYGNGWLVLPER